MLMTERVYGEQLNGAAAPAAGDGLIASRQVTSPPSLCPVSAVCLSLISYHPGETRTPAASATPNVKKRQREAKVKDVLVGLDLNIHCVIVNPTMSS